MADLHPGPIYIKSPVTYRLSDETRHKQTQKEFINAGLKKLGFKTLSQYYQSLIWADFRNKFLEDRQKRNLPIECECCKSNQNLHLHHKNYTSFGTCDLYEIVTIVLLCHDCHYTVHELVKAKKYCIEKATELMLKDLNEAKQLIKKEIRKTEDKIKTKASEKINTLNIKYEQSRKNKKFIDKENESTFIKHASKILQNDIDIYAYNFSIKQLRMIMDLTELTNGAIISFMEMRGWTKNKIYRKYKDMDNTISFPMAETKLQKPKEWFLRRKNNSDTNNY